MENQTKYRAAVIGCGRIGCGFDDDPKRKYIATHAGAYFSNPQIDLIALADVSSEALERYAKEAVSAGMDMTLAQGLGLEADLSFILQSTKDRDEGINAFLEKRTPEFKGE